MFYSTPTLVLELIASTVVWVLIAEANSVWDFRPAAVWRIQGALVGFVAALLFAGFGCWYAGFRGAINGDLVWLGITVVLVFVSR